VLSVGLVGIFMVCLLSLRLSGSWVLRDVVRFWGLVLRSLMWFVVSWC